MASAYGGNGLASVLVAPKGQKPAGASSVKAFVTLRGNARAGFANAQIARRAGLVVPRRKLELRASCELGAVLKPVRISSPAPVLASKAHFSRKVAVVHPYKRVGRERRLNGRMSVFCNARGPVDAVDEKRKVLVNVVDKEMVLKPRAERVESLKQSSELDSGDVIKSDSSKGATRTGQQEKLEITITAEQTEVLVSEEQNNASVSGQSGIMESSQNWQIDELVSEHCMDEVKSFAEKDPSRSNSSQSITTSIVDGKLLKVDTEARETILHVDESSSSVQEPMRGKQSSLHRKDRSFGVLPGFESKPQKKRSAGPQMKGVFSSIKRIIAKDGDAVMGWARNFSKRTGVDKIVAKDVGATQEAVSWVKELAFPDLKKDVTEIVAMRILEDPSAVPGPPREWPRPQYHELSGMAILAADLQTLSSYGDHVKELIGAWRVPLQLAYNPDYVANYFNKRPHLLVFRFLEIAAAFSSVAVQILIDGQRVSKNKSGSRDEEEHIQYTLKSATALKDMLVGLGPTFIKVAQSLSCRPDLIGNDTAKILSELQDRLAPFPTAEAFAVIEQDLGVPLGQVFSRLSVDPVAAASFGQVYRGQTVEGQEVAVKVQRPDMLFTVARDIYILRLGLGLVRKVAGMNSDLSVLADELGRGLFGELDYTLEAANAEIFETVTGARLPYVKVPKTLPHLTTQRVLTMEWIDGFRPKDLSRMARGEALTAEGLTAAQQREAKVALDDLTKKGVESSLVQLLETGVMHADPHPGNMLFTKDGNLTYLDFGLITIMEKKHQAAMLAAIAHLVNGEWACLANDLGDMDVLKPTTDRFALRLALEGVFGYGPDAIVKDGLPDIRFSQMAGKIFDVALKFRLRLPPYYTLVLRSIASLEGMALAADPDYKVFASSYPYVVTRLLTDNSRPTRQVLLSLVLNDKKELRWDRIASIVKTSRGEPSNITGTELVDESEPSSGGVGGKRNIAIALLAFALSQKGSCVRRVIVEADTKALAESFTSAPASSYRRKVANILSEAFYRTGLKHLNIEQECSTSASSVPGEDGTRSAEELTGSGQDFKEVLNGTANISPETLLKNRRLWFLTKVLAGKLRDAPLLQLKVGWTVMTMVCYAAAIALHRVMVTLTDKLLSRGSDRKSQRLTQSPARPVANAQQEPSLPFPALV